MARCDTLPSFSPAGKAGKRSVCPQFSPKFLNWLIIPADMNNSNLWLPIALCIALCGCNKSSSDTTANVAQTPKTKHFKIQMDGKTGFIDGAGKVVILAQYETIR